MEVAQNGTQIQSTQPKHPGQRQFKDPSCPQTFVNDSHIAQDCPISYIQKTVGSSAPENKFGLLVFLYDERLVFDQTNKNTIKMNGQGEEIKESY
eukprot:4151537-Amphidinium_carterae.1